MTKNLPVVMTYSVHVRTALRRVEGQHLHELQSW
jgi:hypothetical protein